MTREDAIKNLEMIRVAFVEPVTKEQRKLIDDTFDTAVKALEQEPLTESDDCVSRGQLDKCLYELRMDNIYDMPSFWCHDNKDYRVIPTKYFKGYEQAIMDIEEKIAKLPSVQPKSKTEHWIDADKLIKWCESNDDKLMSEYYINHITEELAIIEADKGEE